MCTNINETFPPLLAQIGGQSLWNEGKERPHFRRGIWLSDGGGGEPRHKARQKETVSKELNIPRGLAVIF